MTDVSRRPSFAAFISGVREPQIVLAALTRLRWLAVVGQVGATAVAAGPLHLHLPLPPIFAIVLVTALSNTALTLLPRMLRTPAWLVPATLLLDVLLLTSLLYLTGGPNNPFASLYLVHVAMAVIVLRAAWTWILVGAVAACYGVLLAWHRPLGQLAAGVAAIGHWIALVLVCVLIAAFIGRIIRSLRQREAELTDVRERAGRSEQLAALTTLAAGAAHELNTPLGTIAVVAREMELSCEPGGPAVVAEDARLIRREVERCRNILNRMRVDIGDDAPGPGSTSLAQLESRLRESLPEPDLKRLIVSRPLDVDAVRAPPHVIEQALLVLLRNAFDASEPNAAVDLSISRNNGHVRFEVRDRGSGMSPELLRRAGEPFFTTKQPGKGMGLGLFLVRLVAQQCGATFSIDSEVGAGTVCVLELPESPVKNGNT